MWFTWKLEDLLHSRTTLLNSGTLKQNKGSIFFTFKDIKDLHLETLKQNKVFFSLFEDEEGTKKGKKRKEE